jgi:hypothetical protein
VLADATSNPDDEATILFILLSFLFIYHRLV